MGLYYFNTKNQNTVLKAKFKTMAVVKFPLQPISGLLLIFITCYCFEAKSQIWTGNVNSNWTVAGNWSPASVPTAASNVIIPSTAKQPSVPVNTAAIARTVTVQAGGILKILPNGSLTLNVSTVNAVNNAGIINLWANSSLIINGTPSSAVVNSGTFTLSASSSLTISGATGASIVNSGTMSLNPNSNLTINGAAGNGITNSGNFSSKANISVGGPSQIGGHGIQNSGILNIDGGSVSINRTTLNGIFNSAGTFTNKASITLGASNMIFGSGINNTAFFINQNGAINIVRTNLDGILNTAGVFTNQAIISITNNLTTSTNQDGIDNRAAFNNIGGSINIDRNGLNARAIVNSSGGNFTNNAAIVIGGIHFILGHGIENFGSFTNNLAGNINIDRIFGTSSGLYNHAGNLTNQGTINIGSSSSIGGNGIINEAAFTNQTGTISIDRTGSHGVLHNSGTFTNQSIVSIGTTANIGGNGISCFANFINDLGSSISIDRTGSAGIFTSSGTFTNKAIIAIGATSGAINGEGVINVTNFNNDSGTISIDRVGKDGIANGATGILTNKAAIVIGSSASISVNGIKNYGTFINQSGSIAIDRTVLNGILGLAGSFTNTAKITIGAVANIGNAGIQNAANFTNLGGSISIDRTGSQGIFNQISSTFLNNSGIAIGALAGTSIGQDGISNDGNFSNQAGSITIERTNQSGIQNNAGSFTNDAAIAIGALANINLFGIGNRAVFTNSTGTISIDRTINAGILNTSPGILTNKATITIGTLAGLSGDGIYNVSAFINDVCAVLILWDNFYNFGSFTNRGLFTVNTTQVHTNTGSFINDGIIEYPQGNPIPNVTNNDIIVTQYSGCPSASISPALQLGGAVSFTVSSIWYSNPSLTIPAGHYTQTTNTFTFTPPLGVGTYTLYMSINGTPSCPRTVPIQIEFIDQIPPVPVCYNTTIYLDSLLCFYTIQPFEVLAGATDNCGVVNIVSITPSTLTCADIGTTVTVTIVVNDGNGNTASCTSLVTVVQLFHNPNGNSSFITKAPYSDVCFKGQEYIPKESPNYWSQRPIQRVNIFPNPTNGYLTFQFDGELPKSGSLEVSDQWGRIVQHETLTPNQQEHTFSLSSLSPSVYFLKVLDNNIPIWTEKLIKQ